jgi:hypothetical protein
VRAVATSATAAATGRIPAAATTSTMPCAAATAFAENRAGRLALSHGSSQPAATKAYRNPPMTSTHGPVSAATCMLRTSNRKASASMSNRAPSSLTVPVRRATRPSTKSSASAAEASATSATTAGSAVTIPSATRAVTPPISAARPSVTRSAGPKVSARARRAAPPSRACSPAA